MADIKWIKIYTDMVSNKKIKRIRTLPEGNNIVLIWVFLLAQAGECNKNGALYLTDTLPFRPEDLAVEFDFEITVINLALITLERFSMIELFEEIIYIKNWGEYQNIDGLEKIRDQARIRNINYRERRKQLQLSDVAVTSHDATELELDKEIEIDTKKKTVTKHKPKKEGPEVIKSVFGEKVHLTELEYEKLVKKNGKEKTDQMIDILDNYYLTKGKPPYESDYHTMATNGWVFREWNDRIQKTGSSYKPKQSNNGPNGLMQGNDPGTRRDDM